MKRSSTALIAVFFAAFLAAGLAGCAVEKGPVTVALKSGIKESASPSSLRAIVPGQNLDAITSYRVLFKKVEIGNSGTDKFTLWESADGEIKDVAHPVTFDNVQPVMGGTYNYVRVTIGDTLNVDGSVTDADTGTLVTGSGSCVLNGTVYLWGTDIENEAGELTIQAPVTIASGSAIDIQFAVAGTVKYGSGSAAEAVLAVSKPVMHLIAE